MMDPKYQAKISEAERLYETYQSKRRRAKLMATFKNLFLLAFICLVLGLFLIFIYQNQEKIKLLYTTVSSKLVAPSPTPSPTPLPVITDPKVRTKVTAALKDALTTHIIALDFYTPSANNCDAYLNITGQTVSVDPDMPIVIGKRFCIADTSQASYQDIMSFEENLTIFTDQVLKSSNVSPTGPTATLVPSSPTSTPEPTAEATPLPTVRPTVESQHTKRNIEELIQLMKVQNVTLAASDKMTPEFLNGQTTNINLYFANGEMLEYYVLDTKEMEPACTFARTKIVVSTIPFDQAVQYGEAWVFCK